MINPIAPVLNWFIYIVSILPVGLKNLLSLSLALIVVSAIFSIFMRVH